MATYTFKSSMFPPETGEDSQTNPGLFGRALAAWIAEKFASIGYIVEREVAEDFGRLVQLSHPRFKSYIVCCSTDDSALQWRTFPIVEGGGLFAGKEKAALMQKITADLHSILRNETGITDLEVEAA